MIQSSILQEATAGHYINFSAGYAQLPITMEKQPTVVFHNVGQVYFPQSRVECHYSLTSDHRWSSTDWIGIFEVGCTSRKQYHTYTWALVPEGYTEASYLPRPSAVEYQFIYVDKMGKVCARSRPFTFRAPKPLEELETLKEERDEEDGEEEDLLLVITKAQLLQSQLDESLKKQAYIHLALDVAKEEAEKQKEDSRKARVAWELEREAMKQEISELRANMKHNCEILKKIEGNHKNVKYSQENLTSELSKLMVEKDESEQRIQELEEDIKVLNDREKEENSELERQREYEAALVEVRGLQDRLEASEHVAESLRRELRELGIRQGHTNTELHQARLQVAQLTLQLSEENLTDAKKLQDLSCEVRRKEEWLQEERMEREKIEVELGGQRDCTRVLQSDSKRELQELKAAPGSSSEDEENVSSASSRSILLPLFLSTPLERPHRAETPAAETPVSDT
ncbi:hypothetical protein F7725_017206, partial [Dissostichus mawsoni]